jgi:Protein of unknown function (DUF1214)
VTDASTGADGLTTPAVVQELIEKLAGLEQVFREGERQVTDPQAVLEGYKWMFTVVEVAMKAYVWADSGRPRFVDIVGPYLKWGGDNADAFYQFAPIDPSRTYRVTGDRRDGAYFSLTVYGGPDDGRWSERIVGSLNDTEVDLDADGRFEMILGPEQPAGADVAWLRLEPDAVCAITRDYTTYPDIHHRVEWHIECLDPPTEYRLTDADLARRFRAAINWLDDQSSIMPVPPGEPNQFDEPYPVPEVTFGWAAGDAAYAMGAFSLADDEALVITGRSPDCRFWNLCLWNRFLHVFNSDYDRVTINGGQVERNADGSWTIVVSERDPGHPNWITPQGHREGLLWLRWFLPSETPARPECRVVEVGNVPPFGGSA